MTRTEIFAMAYIHVRRQTASNECVVVNDEIVLTIGEKEIAALITVFIENNYGKLCKSKEYSQA